MQFHLISSHLIFDKPIEECRKFDHELSCIMAALVSGCCGSFIFFRELLHAIHSYSSRRSCPNPPSPNPYPLQPSSPAVGYPFLSWLGQGREVRAFVSALPGISWPSFFVNHYKIHHTLSAFERNRFRISYKRYVMTIIKINIKEPVFNFIDVRTLSIHIIFQDRIYIYILYDITIKFLTAILH